MPTFLANFTFLWDIHVLQHEYVQRISCLSHIFKTQYICIQPIVISQK